MTEQPLDDFDLEAFFDSVKEHGLAGALALKQPELPAPAEDPVFSALHRKFQTKIMTGFFSGKSFQSMNAIARQFIDQFEAIKQEYVAYSTDDLERKLYKETTMKTLAKTAKENFNEAVTKSGQSVPNSPDKISYRKEADVWTLIAQIVDTAVELEK